MNNNIRKMNMKSKLIIIIFVPENLILALEFWGGGYHTFGPSDSSYVGKS